MRTTSLFLLLSFTTLSYADTLAVSEALQHKVGTARNSYFTKYDRNRDGFITDQEFFSSSMARRSPSIAEKIFVSLDKNRDGIITEKEAGGKKSKKK